MPWWALAVLMLGANFALWGAVGLIRLAESAVARWSAHRAIRTAPALARSARPGPARRPGPRQAGPRQADPATGSRPPGLDQARR